MIDSRPAIQPSSPVVRMKMHSQSTTRPSQCVVRVKKCQVVPPTLLGVIHGAKKKPVLILNVSTLLDVDEVVVVVVDVGPLE